MFTYDFHMKIEHGCANKKMTGWWFGTWKLWLSIQLGISSSPLTNSIIFQRGRSTTNQMILTQLTHLPVSSKKRKDPMHPFFDVLAWPLSRRQCQPPDKRRPWLINWWFSPKQGSSMIICYSNGTTQFFHSTGASVAHPSTGVNIPTILTGWCPAVMFVGL